jgi:hypothetical protein
VRELSFQQIIETLNKPDTDVLALLRKQKILPSASEVQEIEFVPDEGIADKLREAVLRIDATAPYHAVGSVVAGLYTLHANVNTVFSAPLPPYVRFERFPGASLLPRHPFLFFTGLPPDTRHTVTIDLQVFTTAGTVRITATKSPFEVLVNKSATPVTVPVAFTTNAEGSSSVHLNPVDDTGFDWFGASLL